MAEEISAAETTEPVEDSGLTKPVQESKKEDKSYHKYLVQLKEILPILSVVLVFLGYWNLDSYYSHFGIDIYNYVTASEILLSFLPVIKVIVISMSAIIIVGTILRFRTKNQVPKRTHVYPEINFDLIKFPKIFIDIVKSKNTIPFKSYLLLLYMFNLTIIVLPLYMTHFIYYEILQNMYDHIIIKFTISYFISVTVIITSFVFYYTVVEKVYAKAFDKIALYVIFILSVISVTSVINKGYSLLKMQNECPTPTTILIDNKTITTDLNLVYIGQTQNYIFLRKLKEEVNVIYKMSDIDKLEIEGRIIK